MSDVPYDNFTTEPSPPKADKKRFIFVVALVVFLCLGWLATFIALLVIKGQKTTNAATEVSGPQCVNEPKQCAKYGSSECRVNCYYNGHTSTTITGTECQNWTSQQPHDHVFTYTGNHNYCRNPDGELGPWCYTTNQYRRWQYCFPDCHKDPQCVDLENQCARYGSFECRLNCGYNGRQSKTVSGVQCQNWSSQTPHEHKYAWVGPHNYCRNSDGELGPWCFTTNQFRRWQYCFPDCHKETCVEEERECAHYDSKDCRNEAGYTGTKSHTITGKECQKWSSQTPHEHNRGFDFEDHNFCRNPDAVSAPWCYTTDTDERWEYCFEDCAKME